MFCLKKRIKKSAMFAISLLLSVANVHANTNSSSSQFRMFGKRIKYQQSMITSTNPNIHLQGYGVYDDLTEYQLNVTVEFNSIFSHKVSSVDLVGFINFEIDGERIVCLVQTKSLEMYGKAKTGHCSHDMLIRLYVTEGVPNQVSIAELEEGKAFQKILHSMEDISSVYVNLYQRGQEYELHKIQVPISARHNYKDNSPSFSFF